MSQFFASGGQSIGVSASTSVLPMNIQDWFLLGWTGWISLWSKGLSRVFYNTTVQKCQFLALSFLYSPTLTPIHTAAAAAAAAKSLQSCPTLCNPIDGSPPGSFVPGVLQARILEWVAISFSSTCMHANSLQSYWTLCDPMDSSPPGSSVHRILQARTLEWVAISFYAYMTT